MTEVVTSSAAIPQLSLLAQRQQAFSVDRSNSVNGTDASPQPYQVSPPRLASAAQTETAGHHESAEQRQTDQSASNNSGPSRARIEIRSLDVGLTPSEVVGTLDVLQRFDSNGDGRVDMLEAERASLVREKVTTFAGLAAAPKASQQAAVEAPVHVPTQVVDPTPGASKKLFTPAEVAETAAPKKIFTDLAAQGAPAGDVDVPKKFYGQGAEVVVGPAVAEQPKIHEKVVVQERVPTETGTGETKLYDKVAQTDTDQGQDTDGDSGALYQRAQRQAAVTNETKKTVVVEVNAYTTAAAATDTSTPAATTTVVTA